VSIDGLPPEHFKSLMQVEDRYWWHQTRYRLALSLLRRYTGGPAACRLADVGCGTGGLLRFLGRRGWSDIAGFDHSDVAVEALGRDGIAVHRIDFEAPFTLEGGPYDAITAMDVMEHITNEQAFLEGIGRSLRPGGVFIVTVPAFRHLFSAWDERLGHRRRYTRRGLRKAFEERGLGVAVCRYFFSLAYPMALLRRGTGLFDGSRCCEFPPVPGAVNATLKALGRIEVFLARFVGPPFGTSVFAAARNIKASKE
jgi:SAM-dependent methyltransferase